MITNPNLSRYTLLNVSESDAKWLDLESLKEIDLSSITDDDLDLLVALYPDWANSLVEAINPNPYPNPYNPYYYGGGGSGLIEDFVLFGGSVFINYSLDVKYQSGGTYVPTSQGILSGTTTGNGNPITSCGYYLVPISSAGNLDSILIDTTHDLEYIGGSLPPYLTYLNLQDTGLEQYALSSIPATCLEINLRDNFLNDSSIDLILKHLDIAGGIGGTVSLTGSSMATPTANGLISVDNLVNKGWTVNVNP